MLQVWCHTDRGTSVLFSLWVFLFISIKLHTGNTQFWGVGTWKWLFEIHLNSLLLFRETTDALPALPCTICWLESPPSNTSHTKTLMSAHFPAHADERWALSMRRSPLSGPAAALKPVRGHFTSFSWRYYFRIGRREHSFHSISFMHMQVGSLTSSRCSLFLSFIEFLRWWVWLLCSCFMIASILLMPSFVSHRLSSSSPFIFLIVFFMWLGEEVRQKPKTFFLPIMLTNIHLSVIFLCSFPCLWLFFSHSHLLLCLPPFPPLIFALPHQLLLQMHPKVDFIFQTLLLRGLSIVQRGGGRSQRSCSWLVRMRLLSSALHLSTSFILTRWLCWTLAWKVLFLRLHLHIDRKKVTHYGCRSQACL